jgi:hypothetical protein
MEECWETLHNVIAFLQSEWEPLSKDVLEIWLKAYAEHLAWHDPWVAYLLT